MNVEVSTTSNETPQSEFQFDTSNYRFDLEQKCVKIEPKEEIKIEWS